MTILDDQWTRSAIAASNGDESVNDAGLGEVTSTLDRLLDESGDIFGRLAEVFRSHAGEMRQLYEVAVADGAAGPLALSDTQRQKLRSIVEANGKGDFAAMVIGAAERLASGDRIASEKQNIKSEFGKLKGGQPSSGDFTEEQWLDIGLVAAGASAVLGPEAGAVVLGIAGLIDLFF